MADIVLLPKTVNPKLDIENIDLSILCFIHVRLICAIPTTCTCMYVKMSGYNPTSTARPTKTVLFVDRLPNLDRSMQTSPPWEKLWIIDFIAACGNLADFPARTSAGSGQPFDLARTKLTRAVISEEISFFFVFSRDTQAASCGSPAALNRDSVISFAVAKISLSGRFANRHRPMVPLRQSLLDLW